MSADTQLLPGASLIHADRHRWNGADPAAVSDKREQLVNDAMGLKGCNYPRNLAVGATAAVPISQRALAVPFGVLAGETVNNLFCAIDNAGSGLTLVKMGVYKTDMTPVSASADTSASMTSVGLKRFVQLVPVLQSADVCLLAVYLAVGTTTPGLNRTHAAGGGANAKLAEGTIGACAAMDSQTDLPAVFVPAYNGNAMPFWVGWN